MAATTLFITLLRPCENGTEFYVVNSDSEAARNLAARASVVFLNLAASTSELEAIKLHNKEVDDEAAGKGKAGKGTGSKRKWEEVELNEDADVQTLTDAIAEWLKNKNEVPPPDGDVGSFEQGPKDLVPDDEVRVGCGPLMEGKTLAVFAVWME